MIIKNVNMYFKKNLIQKKQFIKIYLVNVKLQKLV